MLDFYRNQGRKFDVSVSIINKANQDELAQAMSREHADRIMKSANSLVSVRVGQKAESEWVARANQ